MAMVMTVLEAPVSRQQWSVLAQTFQEWLGPQYFPPQLVQSLLVQSASDPEVWQIVAIWQSRDALEEYRRSVVMPGGVLLFRSVGADPILTIYDVVHEVPAFD
jgi:hypothetical protein